MPHASHADFERAIGLSVRFDANFIALGEILERLHREDRVLYADFIKGGFIGSRKAYYLIAVIRTFESLGIPKETLGKIGWTKASTIQPKMNAGNAKELVSAALDCTNADLKRFLQGGTVEGKRRVLQIYLSEEDFEIVSEALVACGGIATARGVDNKEEALVRLSKAYLARN